MTKEIFRVSSAGGTTFLRVTFLAFLTWCSSEAAFAQDKERFAVEVEGGPVWQTRNDVRIPNETGTEFSLVDTIGKGPYGAFRIEVAFDVNERHGFRFIVAPLEIEDSSTLDTSVFFAGETFEPDVATDANYKFSSY